MLSSEISKVLPSSYLIKLLEEDLSNNLPPKQQELLKIFDKWVELSKKKHSIYSRDSESAIELLKLTFIKTYDLIKRKTQSETPANQESFDLSALELGCNFFEDLKNKLSNKASANQFRSIIKLIQDYIIYIDNLTILSREKREACLSRFPPKESEFYQCIGGTQGRLFNVKSGINLLSTDLLLSQIHNKIVEPYLLKFLSHCPSDLESHIPYAILYILGVNKEIIAKKDQFYLMPIAYIAIDDALEFLSTYEIKLNESLDFIINLISNCLPNQVGELSVFLKSYYSLNIDNSSPDEKYPNPMPFYQFDEQGNFQWTDHKDNFIKILKQLKTSQPALPLVTTDSTIMNQLSDPNLPEILIIDILSDDPRMQVKAINILFFLGEFFIGNSHYQFAQSLSITPGNDRNILLEKLKLLSLQENIDLATKQKIIKIIDVAKYIKDQVIYSSLDQKITKNTPYDTIIEDCKSLSIRVGDDYEGIARALAINPNRKDIILFIRECGERENPDHSYSLYPLLQEMMKYAIEKKFSDYLDDLIKIPSQKDDIKKILLDRDTALLKIIIKESPQLIELIKSQIKEIFQEDNRDYVNELFYFACINNRADIVTFFLDLNKDTNLIDIDKENRDPQAEEMDTPLIAASDYGFSGIVKILLENGANPNKTRNDDSCSALHLACEKGHFNIVELLLAHKADVDSKSRNGITVLVHACGKNHFEIVRLLLDRQADVNLIAPRGNSALFFAVKRNNIEMVRLLLDKKANVNLIALDEDSALVYAVKLNNIEMVRLLLDEKANVNLIASRRNSALFWAVKLNNIEMVRLLLARGADVNIKNRNGCPALHIACHKGYIEIVKLLLENNANKGLLPSQTSYTTTISILLKDHLKNIEKKKPQQEFFNAIKNNNIELVKSLLQQDLTLYQQDEEGITPLYLAVENNHTEMVKLLLNKFDPNITNSDGFTPLYEASQINKIEIVKLLLKANVKISEGEARKLMFAGVNSALESENEITPLAVASGHGSIDIVKVLLHKGAKYKADKNGITPIDLAVKNGNFEVVKFLLEKVEDIDINQPDPNGETLLSKAIENKHFKIVELLKQRGADLRQTNSVGNSPVPQLIMEDSESSSKDSESSSKDSESSSLGSSLRMQLVHSPVSSPRAENISRYPSICIIQ
jgi:ankyrin repeat protein